MRLAPCAARDSERIPRAGDRAEEGRARNLGHRDGRDSQAPSVDHDNDLGPPAARARADSESLEAAWPEAGVQAQA